MSVVRLRKTPLLSDVVQSCDAFSKVVDDVKEEKKTTGGLITAVSVAIIVGLVLGELRFYFLDSADPDYKFTVDTDFNETLFVDVDLVVATPCDRLGADISGTVLASQGHTPLQHQLQLNPTRFELTEREARYWQVLTKAHRDSFHPGTRRARTIDQMAFVSSGVLQGLKSAAEEKQAAEAVALAAHTPSKRGGHHGGNMVIVLGNSMGFLQIISDDSGGRDQGTACRIHGSVPVYKVAGTIHIGLGKSISFGGGAHAHFAGFGLQEGNFSHRIERLNFGHALSGLITPLIGTEQISTSNADLYHYYINIVPTRIYHFGPFAASTITYQYAVTYRKRQINHASGSHGTPGITMKYDFSSLVIEVRDGNGSFIGLLVRLCAVVGGVFATSSILNGICSLIMARIYSTPASPKPRSVAAQRLIPANSSTSSRGGSCNVSVDV